MTDRHKYHTFFCFTLRWEGALERHRGLSGFFLFLSVSQSKEKTEHQSVSQNKQTKRHFCESDMYILISVQQHPCASQHNQTRGSRVSIRLAAPPHWKSVFCSDPGCCYEHTRIHAVVAWKHIIAKIQWKNRNLCILTKNLSPQKQYIQQQSGAPSLLPHQVLL